MGIIDTTKKYTTKRGGDVVISITPHFSPEGCAPSASDVIFDGYVVVMESSISKCRYKICCDLEGRSKRVVDPSNGDVILDYGCVQTNFDLVEVTGYHEGKVPEDIQTVARQKHSDIDDYVNQKVDWFSLYMKNKLTLNLYKGKWDNYTIQWVFEKLLIEVAELYNATVRFNDEEHFKKIVNEAADAANYALMMADIVNTKYKERV
jgi:hypothetical protein